MHVSQERDWVRSSSIVEEFEWEHDDHHGVMEQNTSSKMGGKAEEWSAYVSGAHIRHLTSV